MSAEFLGFAAEGALRNEARRTLDLAQAQASAWDEKAWDTKQRELLKRANGK